jgi:hypothetical protein
LKIDDSVADVLSSSRSRNVGVCWKRLCSKILPLLEKEGLGEVDYFIARDDNPSGLQPPSL